MEKISIQSKSFIILFFIALVGTFLATNFYVDFQKTQSSSFYQHAGNIISYSPPAKHQTNSNLIETAQAEEPAPLVDTLAWKTYSNSEFKLQFKYPEDWQIKNGKAIAGFKVIEIDPGAKFFNIKIYISPKNFYGIDGLPASVETINNNAFINTRDLLYAVKTDSFSYTFDVGQSLSLKPKFKTLVHTVQFLP
jgi:hypothetical protein